MELTELVPIAIVAVILVVAWVALRAALKLTATLFKVGCFIIFLIVVAGFILAAIR